MPKRNVILILICFALFGAGNSKAQSADTVFINRGSQLLVDSNTVEAIAFNATTTYSSYNKVIKGVLGDTLVLTIVNTDSLQHNITIDTLGYSRNIPALSSITDTMVLNVFGVFPYYDSIQENRYLGNCGILNIQSSQTASHPHFYWNLHEIDTLFHQAIISGNTVDWSTYAPQYFTINGKSKPHVDSDTTAKVIGSVSDTIYIAVLNSGVSLHSLHFHGYHLTVVQDNKGKLEGWEKDTFPVDSMQSMLWRLVPDKPGMYPVHDHNLTAVSGGGYYPNGMFIMMNVQ